MISLLFEKKKKRRLIPNLPSFSLYESLLFTLFHYSINLNRGFFFVYLSSNRADEDYALAIYTPLFIILAQIIKETRIGLLVFPFSNDSPGFETAKENPTLKQHLYSKSFFKNIPFRLLLRFSREIWRKHWFIEKNSTTATHNNTQRTTQHTASRTGVRTYKVEIYICQ